MNKKTMDKVFENMWKFVCCRTEVQRTRDQQTFGTWGRKPEQFENKSPEKMQL